MAEDGVTYKELHKALGRQTAIIIATLRRSEDRVDDDIKEISDRVTHVERRGRYENIFASALTFLAAYFASRFTGGSG